MKIRCIETTSEKFDLKEVTTVSSNSYDYSQMGYLDLNEEYLVMGICLYRASQCFYYLIDTCEKPYWYPAPLFKIIDARLPKNWFTKIYSKEEDKIIHYITGFDELCNDSAFHDDLIEYEEYAYDTFYNRKKEVEEEFTDQKDEDDLD